MPLLDTNDMAYVRETAESAQPVTVHLLRNVPQEDGQGGFTDAYQIAYADVTARLSEMSGKERLQVGKLNVDDDYVLTLPYDQEVNEGMQVQRGDITYSVIFVNSGRSYDTARRVFLKRQ